MVIGVGIDAVRISKTEKLLKNYGDRFLKKAFTDREIEEGKSRARPGQEFSAWFAAKEAVQKAMGAGVFGGIRFKEIEVLAKPGSKPELRLLGQAEKRAAEMGAEKIHLSLSHEDEYAFAVAVMEGSEGRK